MSCFAEQIIQWATHTRNDSGESQFTQFTNAFPPESPIWRPAVSSVQHFVEEDRKRIKELQKQGIESYGHWRLGRLNADYVNYVDAHIEYFKGIHYYDQVADKLCRLDQARDFLIHAFGSIESVARLVADYQKVLGAFKHPAWHLGPIHALPMTTADIRLSLLWANCRHVANSHESTSTLLNSFPSTYEACRLLSARIAERTALLYYIQGGCQVEDVSISQLQLGTNDHRWKTFDVLVDGNPIDVKNARRSYSSPNTYVEHTIPRYKTIRTYGGEVAVLGVLSEYENKPESLVAGVGTCVVLGEVKIDQIRALYAWMRNRFGRHLNLDGIWNNNFLPGWMFELPEWQYRERQGAIALAHRVLDQVSATGHHSDLDIPLWLVAVCIDHPLFDPSCFPASRRTLINDLRTLNRTIGITLRSLYVYVIGVILETYLQGACFKQTAEQLTEFFFCGRDRTHPLGLIDTMSYIDNLIILLCTALSEANDNSLKLTSFRMPHPAILRAQRDNGSWLTLMAYCGGWHTRPTKVRCGFAPLVYGTHATCDSCGRLICNNCGYCSESCTNCDARQSVVALQKRTADLSYHYDLDD